MELSVLIDRLRCPRCGSGDLLVGNHALSCPSCSERLSRDGMNISADIGQPILSSEWAEMQAGSVERYQDEHYEEDETVAELFGGFVATTLDPETVMFDVGCGLFPDLPAYARRLRKGGYVGLEPLTTPVARNYPCLTGAVAERLPIKDRSFGGVVLATSLDHIENVGQAMSELKRVLAPGGRIYFWVGLHEPEVIAHQKNFHSIFYKGSKPKRAFRIAAAYLEYGLFMWRMARRQRALAQGEPLDHAHFRYYTQKSLAEEIGRCGLEVTRSLLVPGTNSIFVEAVSR